MNSACDVRDGPEIGQLALHERAIADGSMTWNYGPAHQAEQALHSVRPLNRVAVAEPGHGVVLEQIAGKEHARIRHDRHDVRISVAATEEPKFHGPATDLNRHGIVEGAVGRIHDDGTNVVGEVGPIRNERGPVFLPVFHESAATSLVTPDRGRAEHVIAEDVIRMPVGIDHDAHRERCDPSDIRQELTSVRRCGPRVHDERGSIPENQTNLLIEERVAQGENAVADLDPACWVTHDADGTRRAAAFSGPEYAPTMTSTTDSATTRDGIRLLTRHWESAEPRAAVLLVHGLGEHSGRYEEVGERLAAAGLETFAWDHRGFGASGGERAWLDRFSRFHDDVEDRLAAVRAAVPGRPVILYGHSLGGLIALGYAISERPRPDLVVLSAPGVDDNAARWKHLVAPFLARIAPRIRISNGIPDSMLSRDPARQEAAARDPLMLRTSTTGFGARFFEEQARVRASAASLTIPTLVIHGLDDPIVPPSASEPLAATPGVTRLAYPGLRHELHNEPEGPQVLDDVVAWIDARLVDLAEPRSGLPAAAV